MKTAKVGEKIYVPGACYVYRGEDDFEGGMATISEVEYSDDLPEDHFNYIMVGIIERPGTMYNYKNLMEQQIELKVLYGDSIAHPDPDNREEFNCPDADWR